MTTAGATDPTTSPMLPALDDPRRAPPWQRIGVPAAAGVAGLALSGWVGTLSRTDVGSGAAVLSAVGAALAVAVVAGRDRQRSSTSEWLASAGRGALRRRASTPGAWTAGLVWVALIAATVGWDLYALFAASSGLPTLSRLIGAVTAHRAGRAAVFAGWLVLGVVVALGWRRPGRRHGRVARMSAGDAGAAGARGR